MISTMLCEEAGKSELDTLCEGSTNIDIVYMDNCILIYTTYAVLASQITERMSPACVELILSLTSNGAVVHSVWVPKLYYGQND